MRAHCVLTAEASWQLRDQEASYSQRTSLNYCCAEGFAKQRRTLKAKIQSLPLRVCSRRVKRRRSFGTSGRCYACSTEHRQCTELTRSIMPPSNDDGPLSDDDDYGISRTQTLLRDKRQSIFQYFFADARNVFKADILGLEIAVIALPALLALAADPLASLVDTAFIGRLGSVELAAVGVSIAVFNLVSKLLNFPVLNLTTSFVAEEAAEDTVDVRNGGELEMGNFCITEDNEMSLVGNKPVHAGRKMLDGSGKRVLPAVSTALVVGSVLGILELIVLTAGSGPILEVMGVSVNSDMRVPAERYLALRAIGAPAVVVALAVQGVFRGFKDTRTPLYATVTGNVINIVLVPILMFSFGYGVGGAAVATVISQYIMALILLLKMSKRVVLLPPNLRDLDFKRFLQNGGLLLARSTAVMLSLTLATSQAARLGAIPMAAHQICMQIWLAASLLSDAIALAAQAIIAGALAKGDYDSAKDAAFRTLQMGGAFGFILSILLGFGLSTFTKLFTNDSRVLEFLALGIPFVAGTQPINSLAFVFDGLHFGALDFVYAAQSMVLVAFVASAFMLVAGPMWGFVGIWVGLTLLMTLRMFAGFVRIGTASGPWRFLK